MTPILGLSYHDAAAPLLAAAPDVVDFLSVPAERLWDQPDGDDALIDRYRLAVHGSFLALTAATPFDAGRARRLAGLADRCVFEWVAERLEAPADDTPDLLERVAERVERLQDFLGASVLVSVAATFRGDPAIGQTPVAFLGALADRTGCGLLLDLDALGSTYMNDSIDLCKDIDALDSDTIRAIATGTLATRDGQPPAPGALLLRLAARCRRMRGITVDLPPAQFSDLGVAGLAAGLAGMRESLQGQACVVAFPNATAAPGEAAPPRPRGYLPGQGRSAPMRLVHCAPEAETPPAATVGEKPPGTGA